MLKDRFKSAREQIGLTQESLAKQANVSQTTIYKIESGETVRPRKLDELAKLLNVTPEWLQFGSENESQAAAINYVNIPILEVELSAGSGSVADLEHATDWVPISRQWIIEQRYPQAALKAVTVTGDSMSPRLQNGDMLLVNTADNKPVSGNIYAIAVDNELRVKRLLKRMDGSWIISSDNKANPAYVDETISHHNFEQLRIIGRAVKVLMGDL